MDCSQSWRRPFARVDEMLRTNNRVGGLGLRTNKSALLWELGARAVESHISRKTSEMPRISCTQLWIGPHEVQGTHETTQEIGGVGHPAIVAGIEPKSAFLPHFTCRRQVACSKARPGPPTQSLEVVALLSTERVVAPALMSRFQSKVVGRSGCAACSNICSIWNSVMRGAESLGKASRRKNATSGVSKLGLASPPIRSHRKNSL
jgi:hypothetical protein